MKRKGIIFSLIGIVLVSTLFIVLITKKSEKYIYKDGIMLAMTLDGSPITEFPEDRNYKVDINCTNAKGTWLVEEWKFSISEVTGNVKCGIDFYTREDSDKLISIVETPIEEKIKTDVDYMNQADYPFSTADGYTWNEEGQYWTTKESMYFEVSGSYSLCYRTTLSSADGDYVIFEEYNYWMLWEESYSTMSDFKCVDVDDTDGMGLSINLTFENYSGTSSVDFYLATVTKTKLQEEMLVNTGTAGYRYTGMNPDNYIWFNNEMWRIIGSIPTCTTASCGTNTTNLVKIIKDEVIGGVEYDSSSTTTSERKNSWGENTLYKLLNEYYYGAKNGTYSGYCFAKQTSDLIGNCNYEGRGILPNSYYGNMVEEVYWNTGSTSTSNSISGFGSEAVLQTTAGYVGLLSISDYGLAAKSNTHTSTNSSSGAINRWIGGSFDEHTLTKISTNRVYTLSSGSSHYKSTTLDSTYSFRPVVYLDPNVYVVSGDGTEANPYQISL